MAKIIQEEDLLTISPKFDIHTPVRRKPRKYADYDITIGAKQFDDLWHYWWLVTVSGEEYGSVFVAEIYHKNVLNLCYVTAVKSIDKILGNCKVKRQSIKKLMGGK